MALSESQRTARGIAVNWVALVSGFVALYFLSPLVVARLGATAYGAWVVVGSLVSYIALLDLGMRGAAMLLVARYSAAGEHAKANDVVSAVFTIRLGVALVALAASVALGLFIERLVDAPAPILAEVRVALVLGTGTVVVTLLGGVFGGVLAALNRFDVISAGAVLQTVVRAAAVVLVLRATPSLVGLAAAELGAALLTELLLTVCAFRCYPDLRLSIARPRAAVIHSITAYAGSLTVVNACMRVMQYSQSLVISVFLPVSAVALFAIGNTLIEGVRQVFYTIAPVLTPLASRFEAAGKQGEVTALVQGGTRLMLIVTLPILVTLYLRGETFIGLWMGAEYRDSAGGVLRILTIGMFFVAATASIDSIVLGLHDLRATLALNGLQALATVVLSVALVRPLGIDGVAWAVTLPALALRTLLWPAYVCRRVGLPFGRYLLGSWCRPALATAAFAAATLLAERYWMAESVGAFFGQVMVLLPLYAAGCAVVLWPDVRALARLRHGVAPAPAAVLPGAILAANGK